MAHPNGWHRGDRAYSKTGQCGIVEGWKGDQLYIFWGAMNSQQYRSWVPEEDMCWGPAPLDVLDKDGKLVASMHQEIHLPADPGPLERFGKETPVGWTDGKNGRPATPGGCDLSQYPLL